MSSRAGERSWIQGRVTTDRHGVMRGRFLTIAVLALGLGPAASVAAVDPFGAEFGKTGYIRNETNEWCAYTQVYEETNPHFLPASRRHFTHQDVRTLRFDDPGCMAEDSASTAGRVSSNVKSINDEVSRWFLGTYYFKDADFDTGNLRLRGKYEARGACIQSRRYPQSGIAIEYLLGAVGIASVIYMPAFAGCGPQR